MFNINELDLMGFGADPNRTDPYEVSPYSKTNPGPFDPAHRLFVVNGNYQPTLQVRPGQVVRFRMLNASARTTLPISIQGTQMRLCALDGIAIPSVRSIPSITLAQGNRADVLVRFDAEGTYEMSTAQFQNSNVPAPGVLARVEVAGAACDMPLPTGALPVPTSIPDILPGEVTAMRDLRYAIDDPLALTPNPDCLPVPPGPEIPAGRGTFAPNFTMDGVRFAANVVNQELRLGSVLEWTLWNQSNRLHSHHIHIHPFQVIQTSDDTLNGMPFPPPQHPDWEPLWLDTIAVPTNTGTPNDRVNDGWVKVRQRYPDNPGFYVIHRHILTHEDIGMMPLVHLSS